MVDIGDHASAQAAALGGDHGKAAGRHVDDLARKFAAILDLPEDRRHQRVANRDQMVTLTMADGSQEQCAILDLSVSGVAVVSSSRPPMRSMVQVGKAPGRVVRHLENGFAVEFSLVLNPDLLKTTIAQG